MSITAQNMLAWLQKALGADPSCPKLPMEKYLAAIPRMECLKDVPKGNSGTDPWRLWTPSPARRSGEGDIRLRSMKDTLQFCVDRGWKTVIFGHIGREPEKVAQ